MLAPNAVAPRCGQAVARLQRPFLFALVMGRPMHVVVKAAMERRKAFVLVGWLVLGTLIGQQALAARGGDEDPGVGAVAGFWWASAAELDAFAPDWVVDEGSGRLRFRGWHDRWWEARWWMGDDGLPCIVVLAHVPDGWEPPEDGRTWLVLQPDDWTSSGLPDAKAYCLREQALAVVQAGRVLGRVYGRPVRMVVVSEGIYGVAALAAACAEPKRVVGLVLIAPRPYRHFEGGRTGFSGPGAAELERLVRDHPEWVTDLRRATQLYDIAVLGPAVDVPVVAIGDTRWWPQWLDLAADRGGWYCIGVDAREPSLGSLSEARWFGELWAECLAALGQSGEILAAGYGSAP